MRTFEEIAAEVHEQTMARLYEAMSGEAGAMAVAMQLSDMGLPNEALAAHAAMVAQSFMEWLDSPLPERLGLPRPVVMMGLCASLVVEHTMIGVLWERERRTGR